MKWIKTILSGLTASLIMKLFLMLMIKKLSIASINIPPSAAFLYNLGIEHNLLSLLLHFSYGTFWALVFVYAFEEEVSVLRGTQLAVVLWVFMMLVYSPIIGWGFFGMSNASLLPPDHPLYLGRALPFILSTLFVHLVYGAILGGMSQRLLTTTGNTHPS